MQLRESGETPLQPRYCNGYESSFGHCPGSQGWEGERVDTMPKSGDLLHARRPEQNRLLLNLRG